MEIADGTIDEKIRAWQDLVVRLESASAKLDLDLAEQEAGYRLPYYAEFWPSTLFFFAPSLIAFAVGIATGTLHGKVIFWISLLFFLALWLNTSSQPRIKELLLKSKSSREKLLTRKRELEGALEHAHGKVQFWINEKSKYGDSSKLSNSVSIPSSFPPEATSVPHWVDPNTFRWVKVLAKHFRLFLVACLVLWLLSLGVDGVVKIVLNKWD